MIFNRIILINDPHDYMFIPFGHFMGSLRNRYILWPAMTPFLL